ncbi:MFS transporter [Engelhardtia mirabilis]|uniref:Muropeptide transporter n=1 Tax=Engelhardtia mirabilis TaxID=2528011 RepID=A0A518BHD6_9BACT|nr:muropeptide transporter [Planctomycetes bacterium Pla133]QDV00690.1 muropeptide transporter [Planctomycetes bacterium Pla86]
MNLLESRGGRRLLFSALYLCEGAPIGFLWWALPTLLRSRGVEADRIGSLLAWLVLPWAFKWLWAPMIDRLGNGRWGLRGWIAGAQIAMAATLLPLLRVDPLAHFELLVVALVAHAVCASTQDAAIDALMIRNTAPHERGRLSGWMQLGMLTGRSLLGGGALLVVGAVGERALVATLLAVLLGGLVLAAFYREADAVGSRAATQPAPALLPILLACLGQRRTWVGLAFAATAGAGFEALGAFAGPILSDLADGNTNVAGQFFLIHAVVAAALGGLVGGAVADRIGARRATGLVGVLLAVAVLTTAAGISSVGSAGALVPHLTFAYATIGAFTAASYALFMDLTDPRVAATQFSAYMSATNLCESWAVAVAGGLIAVHGYASTLVAMAGVGVLALPLLLLLAPSGTVASMPTPRPASPGAQASRGELP